MRYCVCSIGRHVDRGGVDFVGLSVVLVLLAFGVVISDRGLVTRFLLAWFFRLACLLCRCRWFLDESPCASGKSFGRKRGKASGFCHGLDDEG